MVTELLHGAIHHLAVVSVQAAERAFAAILEGGSVVTWGSP